MLCKGGSFFLNKIIFPILLLLALTGTGCSRNAATINGNSIPDSEINRIVAAQEQLMGLPSENQKDAIRKNVIEKIIDQTLLLQEAKKQGITVSDQEITQKYNELKKEWDLNSETQKSLKAQGFTESNMKDKAKDQLIIDKLSQSLVQVSNQQIKDYYQSHLYEFSLYTKKDGTVSFNQLPVQIQQSIREGKNVLDQSQTQITKITQQPFDQVQEQAKDILTHEQQIAKTQELITKLRQEAKISMK